jgi:phosphoribosyl 1,2-cyclic phosphate phosphodiesterase
MDDLRSFNLLHRSVIPLYGLPETLANIRRVFNYAFADVDHLSSIPHLTLNAIDERPFVYNDLEITPIPLLHGQLPVLGYRIGDFAYCTDVSFIPPSSRDLLRGLLVLILGALRHKPHPTHFNLAQAIAAAGEIGAGQTYFTHISHQVLHAETEADLPPNIHLAYDGLTFDLGFS